MFYRPRLINLDDVDMPERALENFLQNARMAGVPGENNCLPQLNVSGDFNAFEFDLGDSIFTHMVVKALHISTTWRGRGRFVCDTRYG
ncbi:hypothetical protein METHB2_390022 [Candidatus Methylobacter favarea]|uniref:Uncharacterized protein n=1 Tax=Candidatus Methylobacter favarea TaxID=2707345 RepID=A0A8S0X1K2_9GAMM|nr:hypothetical protein [Candidatus Methylobacter favarea]CAA9891288.1 hypothetical protein METHB2_390022 [Candidatus Methylobacter favarea]